MILDWAPNHDPRSLDYPIRETVGRVERRDRQWDTGPVTDQGREGACVGFAWTNEATAKPVPADLTRLRVHAPHDPNLFASFLYGMAQYIDEWEGQAYSGTSVLAGAKAAQNAGLLKAYRWAFNIDDVIDAIITTGPVVIGIPWYDGMYQAPNGVLRRAGSKVGGHALLATGYTQQSEKVGGPSITLQNSWGDDWGINGLAEIAVPDLTALLAEQGEACVPTSRSYGR